MGILDMFQNNGLSTILGLGDGGAMPPGILANDLYDPQALRRKKIKGAMLGALAGSLGADRAPRSFADQIGMSLAGGMSGGEKAADKYTENALLGTRLQRDNETYQRQQEDYGREADARQAREAWLKSQPGPVQNMLRANPELIDDYVKATTPAFQTAGNGESYFGTPLPVTGPDGAFAGYGLPSKAGGFKPLDPGTGRQFMSPYDKSFNTKSGAVDAASQGEARAAYNSLKTKMPGLESVVSQLDGLAEKATYTLAGQTYNAGRTQLGMEPTEGAIARTQYQSVVANQILPLLRDTFGAQFTAREGDVLMATLGDPNKTPAEKQAVLKSFIDQKRRDVEALAAQSGVASPSGTGTGTTSTGVPWSVE